MGIFEWFSPIKLPSGPTTYKFSQRAKIVTLWVVTGLLSFFLLFTAHLLPVFIWAAATAYLLNPLVTAFSRKAKIPRAISIALLYLVIGGLLFWGLKAIVPAISNEISDLTSGQYEQPSSFLAQVAVKSDINVFGANIQLKPVIEAVSGWVMSQFNNHALPIFFGALERAVLLIIFFIVTFYFLLEAGKYRIAFERIIPDPYRVEISDLIERINYTLGSYIRAQVVLILIMTGASFLILSILKIKYAVLLSIMTGILEVIPIVGPICATVIVALIAMFQATAPYGISNTLLALLVIISYFLLRQLEDYFVIPNIAARFVKVHPVLGIFALLVGGSMGGVLGLFLAIPTAAILKVLFSYIYKKLSE